MARLTGCMSGSLPFKLLSIGGRSTLVKAVLGSIWIYYMSSFKVLESTLSDIERLRAKFLWGGELDSKLMIWIKWETVLASLKNEDLVIDRFINGEWNFKWIRPIISG
ncbi:ribonuclease H protein [Artemisia annua]|uniref:Ribonuclease H protein n=1 Tax=Artemisia annua TaxID=35608 RepID=A0A2U1NS87_ARTAN|nr:ribonuclease H protein [Artemisia annua]